MGGDRRRLIDVQKPCQDPPGPWSRVRALRKAAGYTQQELAQELGVSRRMIAYYEGET